jgi:predicted dehydrogenase
MPDGKIKLGIIGCGFISRIYLENARKFAMLEPVACADIVPQRAARLAEEFGVPKACTVEDLLNDTEIGIVLNLTNPKAHAAAGQAVLQAGKHLYNEKPLAVELCEGKALLENARRNGLRLSSAPDTFLGAGLQTCRKLIDIGAIGVPIAATAFMMCHGHESWHPDPEFYYQMGAGPMFDMGPYYLTALVSLLGPVQRVTGSARISFPERLITSEPKKGGKIAVETPTHVAGVLDLRSGVIATIVTSFDVWAAEVPRIEIYGSEATLSVPDPNYFDGPVRICRPGSAEWVEVPLEHAHRHNSRCIGAAEMAAAILSGRPHRATGEMAYHVLEIMHAIHSASREGRHITLEGLCERPAPLPQGLQEYTFDD